ncbi:MAG: endolytic transglycosylase MltG [Desulfarculaceae bacterium]|nr:endolytic transglycosylase MltG [Desulfarculaceae bacterium]MCF8072598.1 endolytic transglycosylase MltG [Desulfarculaceae bacterium]MCF8103330.1 endolytic transglycosylase MltG [Desulfarculaceae bacterium]MCF8118254.1 endolytic transglycosylase MltG [Desulfarculaceae bacterium]
MRPGHKSALGLVVAVIVVTLAGWGAYVLGTTWLLGRRASPSGVAIVVDIPKGASLSSAGEALAKAGVVDNPRWFALAGRITSDDGPILAGEYELSPAMSAARILQFLRQGRVKLHYVLIPEGFTLADIAARLGEAGIVHSWTAIRLGRNPEFAADLEVNQPTLEGYLFPDTYRFPRHLGTRTVLSKMVARFDRAWAKLAPAAKAAGMSREQAVILASIIQKEAGVDQEMPLISAVYHNRLKRGMRLQADPTVIYGLGPAFDGNLTRADLDRDTPYNTYAHTGLPPGPICSPGLAALRAALAPAKASYLYFVAKGDGRHQFSVTYAQHLKAVNHYQRKRR